MGAIRLFDPDLGFQRLERYELIGELASGGMATVYLARLRGAGGFRRFFAIKRLLPHLAEQTGFIEMFLDEARLAAAIRHPNVVPILEVGAGDFGHFIVMEYIEGDSLAGLLERGLATGTPIPVPIALRIALDMLAGLHAAHELQDEQGVPLQLVHRDVSPQNVLIGADGVARISDFGIARAATRLSSTRDGQLKGKLAYMAPEYVLGERCVDRRADIFAVGIVVWEMLARSRLFKGDNEAETLARVVVARCPRLHDVAPSVSERTSAVVMRALQRQSGLRYATCAEFAEALEESARGDLRLASSRELSAFVNRILGDTIARQRQRVRSCVERLEKTAKADTLADGTPRDLKNIWSTIRTVQEMHSEATSSAPTIRDVLRLSDPGLGLNRPHHAVLLALALTVLGTGGGVGAYLGVRAGAANATEQGAAATSLSQPLDTPVAGTPTPAATAAPPLPSALASGAHAASSNANTTTSAIPRTPRLLAHMRARNKLTPKTTPRSPPAPSTPQNPYR